MSKKSKPTKKSASTSLFDKKILGISVVLLIVTALVVVGVGAYYFVDKENNTSSSETNSELVRMYMAPATPEVSDGSVFTLEILIDTQDQSINAAQANIIYDNNSLEFVGIDSTNGVLDMKLIEKEEDGQIEIVHGTAQSFGGEGLLARISFRAKAGSGSSVVSFSNGTGMASSDTNEDILQQSFGATISLSK